MDSLIYGKYSSVLCKNQSRSKIPRFHLKEIKVFFIPPQQNFTKSFHKKKKENVAKLRKQQWEVSVWSYP